MRHLRTQNDTDHDNDVVGKLTAIDFTYDPGRTIQEPAQDADINVLMKRMGVKDGSVLPHFSRPQMLYGDFSLLTDDPVELAEIMRLGAIEFQKLPATLRNRFEGSPEKLLSFMNDDANYEEAVELGLLAPKPAKVAETDPNT